MQRQFICVPCGAHIPSVAEPFDIHDVRFLHHRGHSSFHALLEHHNLTVPVLAQVARIIDEADMVQAVKVRPAVSGPDLMSKAISIANWPKTRRHAAQENEK